jgi:hypothetical protein
LTSILLQFGDGAVLAGLVLLRRYLILVIALLEGAAA